MSLCKQTEHPNFTLRIKINSESIIESETCLIIVFEKFDRFPQLIRSESKFLVMHRNQVDVSMYMSFWGHP